MNLGGEMQGGIMSERDEGGRRHLAVFRHAPTKKGEGRGQGSHLSAEGVTLARQIGADLGPFDRVYVSTIPRTMETALAMGYAVTRILGIERALDERTSAAKGQSYAKRIADAAKPLQEKLDAVRDSLVEIHSHADQITLHYPVRYYNMLLSLAGMVQSADMAPTQQEGAIYRDIAPKVDAQLARLRGIESSELAAFNALMRELNVPAVLVSAPAIVP